MMHPRKPIHLFFQFIFLSTLFDSIITEHSHSQNQLTEISSHMKKLHTSIKVQFRRKPDMAKQGLCIRYKIISKNNENLPRRQEQSSSEVRLAVLLSKLAVLCDY